MLNATKFHDTSWYRKITYDGNGQYEITANISYLTH